MSEQLPGYIASNRALVRYDDSGLVMIGGGATERVSGLLGKMNCTAVRGEDDKIRYHNLPYAYNFNGWGETPKEKRTPENFVCQATYRDITISDDVETLKKDAKKEGIELTVEQGFPFVEKKLSAEVVESHKEIAEYCTQCLDLISRGLDQFGKSGIYDPSMPTNVASVKNVLGFFDRFLENSRSGIYRAFKREYQGLDGDLVDLHLVISLRDSIAQQLSEQTERQRLDYL